MARSLHQWNVTCAEARRMQQELAAQVKLCALPAGIEFVAGADTACIGRRGGVLCAAVVVLRLPGLELVEEQTARAPAQFPYVPGLLSFREGPAVLAAMEKLRTWPDAVILDGQGIAHPRRLGLAAHLGLWLGIPTVGCAKSRLVGKHGEPGAEGGDWTPLMDGPDLIGSVVRTKSHVRPLYVSPGHLCDHEGARRLVLDCCTGYRVPEPTRRAHLAVARAKALGGRP